MVASSEIFKIAIKNFKERILIKKFKEVHARKIYLLAIISYLKLKNFHKMWAWNFKLYKVNSAQIHWAI